MKKRILSIALITILLATTLFTGVASANMIGDVNGDGKITAADARLTLRASVKLETLDENQTKAADVDGKTGLTAADARLILRASVGLEVLEDKEEEKVLKFNGHTVEKDCISIENGIVCADAECCGEILMPSFNDLVNKLKTPGSLNYFYGFSKTTANTPKPTCKANGIAHYGLAEVMEGLLADSVEPGEVIEYSDLTKSRHVNNATFYVHGTPYVSDLKDEDVKSITMEKMSGVDFVKNLPATYTSADSGESYSLAAIKAAQIGDVYKVTVTLNSEKVTNNNLPEGVTPVEKIINSSYNDGLKKTMADLDSAFSDMPEMAGMFVMDMEITTDVVVTYYFTADTYEPVAAKYDIDMKTNSLMHTYFNNFFVKTDKATTTTTITNDTLQESYFFFNDFFNEK